MKRKQGLFFGIAVLLIAVMFTVTGCDNGTTSGDDNTTVDDGDNNGNENNGENNGDNNGNEEENSGVESAFFLPDGYAWVNSGGTYTFACVFKEGSLYSYMQGTGGWTLLTTLQYSVSGNNLETTSSTTGAVTTYSISAEGNLIATATTVQTFTKTEVTLPSS
jgi:hypothetical protein